MMQKDEYLRLEPWIQYYSALFGSRSLFLFDNGSTQPQAISILEKAARDGATVIWSHSTRDDYAEREKIFAAFIKQLDTSDPHDFYLPLDCDEFIACEVDGKPSLEASAIQAALLPHTNSPYVLKISHKYWHNPYRRGLYQHVSFSEKSFFASGSCESLGVGFHYATTKIGNKEQRTDIVYFEFHYQPYEAHIKNSRDKLSSYTNDLSRAALRHYAESQSMCFHCAIDLLKSEYDYARDLLNNNDQLVPIPDLLNRFDQLGIAYEQLFASRSQLAERVGQPRLLLQHWMLQTSDGCDHLLEHVRSVRQRLRHLARAVLQR